MEMYILIERLDRIEKMLRFIVDDTIANGMIEELKKEDIAKESREKMNDAVEVLTTEMGGFIVDYLDKYFTTDEEEEEEW